MQELGTSRDEMNDTNKAPWVYVADGIQFKLVKAFEDESGWISLLRLKPGTVVGPHRHSGEVHGFVLQGTRKLMDGTVCGAGSYVYEPAGNVDTWSASGDEDLISMFHVVGSVEYIGDDGEVTFRETTASKVSNWAKGLAENASR